MAPPPCEDPRRRPDRMRGAGHEAFRLAAALPDSEWSAELYDAWSGGHRITEMIEGGWLAPPLAPGGKVFLRLEVSPASSRTGSRTHHVAIEVSATNAPTPLDAAHAVTTGPTKPRTFS